MTESRDNQSLELLSIAGVCKALDIGKSRAYRRLRNRGIPSVKLGRSMEVKRTDQRKKYSEEHRLRTPGE